MTNLQDTAPFSIAVALPAYRKSLVERMLASLRQQSRGLAWRVVDTPDADVVLRAAGDEENDLSAGLVADVRRAGGGTVAVAIESPWRAGALLNALGDIARVLGATPPVDARNFDAIAWQWLRRWSELVAADVRAVELQAGGRPFALFDLRSSTWRRLDGATQDDLTALLAVLARDGYALAATDAVPPMAGAAPFKPFLWRLGVFAGTQGPLPALAARGALRLKGWPYLAAGGPKSYAALIAQLRDGVHDHASLRVSGMSPAAELYGFLNACLVCDFFHDDVAGAAVPAPPLAKPPPHIPRPAAAPDKVGAVLASIRRSLGVPQR
jgi:hypothetical protein